MTAALLLLFAGAITATMLFLGTHDPAASRALSAAVMGLAAVTALVAVLHGRRRRRRGRDADADLRRRDGR